MNLLRQRQLPSLLLALSTMLCFWSTTLIATEEESSIFSYLPTEERLQELTEIAEEVAKIRLKSAHKNALSFSQFRKLSKLHKRVQPSERNLLQALYSEIETQRENQQNTVGEVDSTSQGKPEDDSSLEISRTEAARLMEEMVVVGTPFSGVPEHPEDFSVADIGYMRVLRTRANSLYSSGHFAEAYPLLLELAKRGIKDSQSRLAYILFHGTEGVPKSNYRAIGWLGAAASGRTEPIFRVLLNRHLRKVPPSQQEKVQSVIAGYAEEYGYPEHIKCTTNHRFSNGRVKRTYCEFKLEQIANACGGLCWAHRVNVREES